MRPGDIQELMQRQFGARRPLVGLQNRRGGVFVVAVVAGIVAQREAWTTVLFGFRLAKMRLRKGLITRVGPEGCEDALRSPTTGHGGFEGEGGGGKRLDRVRPTSASAPVCGERDKESTGHGELT